MNPKKILFCAFLFAYGLFSQPNGNTHFEFVNLSFNARQTALGGENVSATQNDPGRFFYNPSLLDSTLYNYATFSFLMLPANIRGGQTAYIFKKKKKFFSAVGIQFINYGEFKGRDEFGEPTQNFYASEFAPQVTVAHAVNNFELGASTKFVYSNLAGYSASAISMDMGGNFKHPNKDIVIGMVVKNVGLGLARYSKNEKSILPLDIQIGSTFKPEHMPVRFSVTAQKLFRYDIAYYDPNLGRGRGNLAYTEKKPDFFDKFIRHWVLSSELLLSKNLHIIAGYNFLRRKDLKIQPGSSGWAGFSIGTCILTKKIKFYLAHSIYHISGSITSIACNLNLNNFKTH
jgi:hypothetical protein